MYKNQPIKVDNINTNLKFLGTHGTILMEININ